MENKEKTDNYENVNMDVSDGSDNEMFACKDEYKAFKNQFSGKPKPKQEVNEYGGDSDDASSRQGLEFSGQQKGSLTGAGGGSEYGGASEYGPVATAPTAPVGYRNPNTYPGYHQERKGRPGFGLRSPSPKPTPAKIEREPKLYKDEEKKDEKRSRSR